MILAPLIPLLALAAHPPGATPADTAELGASVEHVRVTARILVVDRDALTEAGLSYVVVGPDRVRVSVAGRRASRGGAIEVGSHGVTAFLDAVRSKRWVRSESTQEVLTMSGGRGVVSSTDLAVGRWGGTRTRGPSLVVRPTVLDDGGIHLRVMARHEDVATSPWGYGVDGSPAAVEAEVVTPDGQEVLLASSSAVERTREAGLLRWTDAERGRDVLVTVTARVVRP